VAGYDSFRSIGPVMANVNATGLRTDGTSGIPQGVTFLKIPNTPCQNLHLKCQPNVGRFLKEFD
jgi:hypothetical protein